MSGIIAKGTATVIAGTTSVVVSHGLSIAPSLSDILLEPQDDLQGISYWPSDPTATTFQINLMTTSMVDHVFTWVIIGTMTWAAVGAGVNCELDLEIVRKRVGLSGQTTALPDADIKQYLGEAAAWLSQQIGETLVHTDCDEEEADAIRNVAAIKGYYQVTGTSSSGWTANIGPVTFSGSPDKVAMLHDLWRMVQTFIKSKQASETPFRAGAANY
jgi:hypothetical protein